MGTRITFRELIAKIVAEPDIEGDAWHQWHQETRDRSHEFEQAERDVLTFLATLASVVFRGRLSPDLAYTVVGLDVVRRSRQIRVLLGTEEAHWTIEKISSETEERKGENEISDESLERVVLDEIGDDEDGPECPWVYWVDSLPGLTDRVYGLLDILWAEAARRYDLQTHDLVAAALLKHSRGSGLRNRLRVRRIAKEHGSRLATWKLEWGLLSGEFLRTGPPRKIDILDLEIVPPLVQGWGFRGWVRRRKAFVLGRLKKSRRLAKFALPE